MCSICLGDKVCDHETKCGHAFHLNCLFEWAKTGSKTCPNCRAKVVRIGVLVSKIAKLNKGYKPVIVFPKNTQCSAPRVRGERS